MRSLSVVPAGARRAFLLVLLGLVGGLLLWTPAHAQQGTVPPSAFAGTISLNGAPIPTDQLQGTNLQAFINGVECTGTPGQKFFFEEGGVTLYRMDVLAKEDREGCGSVGDEVEFFINGESTGQTSTWELGRLIIVNLNLGSGEPTDIPTPTATIPGATNEPETQATRILPAEEAPATREGSESVSANAAGGEDGEDGEDGDPGAEDTVAAGNEDDSSGDSGDGSQSGDSSEGGEEGDEGIVDSATATSEDDDGGFPVWAGILIGIVGVGVIGGGAGALLYRRTNGSPPAPPAQPGV